MTKIGLIGFGSIGREVYKRLCDDPAFSFCILTRSPITDLPDSVTQTRELAAFLRNAPDLVVECAGHHAVQNYATKILGTGTPLLIASLGALADADLAEQIDTAAKTGNTHVIYPSGAIGGLDVLRAVAAEGQTGVKYTGTKPPDAWTGSAAEGLTDLSQLQSAETFFTGTARAAATLFPKNANVVAALALATGDFDGLQVELVADPDTTRNTHGYSVTTSACKFTFEITNAPSPNNPRTSLTTVLSIVESIRNFANMTSKE